MSRTQQDSVIDDDEETCPLCIEEFDLSDKNFKPCPCGYQICQFCFNSLKTTYEKSNCPNCRRPYDEKTIQYKIPTAEEFKLDLQNKTRKQAAAKRKETEKREIETSSRRNLAGVRVKQTNLVYVIGLIPTIKDETSLLQTLRGPDYFGQYGEIEKIVVSKAKASSASQGIGVYVTYARKEDAALCIQTVDGSMNGERVLRAQYGTTKYCSAFLRGEVCNNKNCSFLHETGEDGQTTSLQAETNGKLPPKPLYPNLPTQMPPPARPTPPTTNATISSQPMARQSSKEEPESRKGSTDASALPSSVSWANINNAQLTKTRRASQTASNSTSSPSVSNVIPAPSKLDEGKTRDSTNSSISQASGLPPTASQRQSTIAPPPGLTTPSKARPDPFAANKAMLDGLIQRVSSPDFRFVFDESAFTEEELVVIGQQPVLIDPYGGAKRRLMLEKEKLEQERQETETQAAQELHGQRNQTIGEELAEEENLGSGSLALGGEPEDDPRIGSNRGAIQRPPQTTLVNNFMNDQFSSMNIGGRTFTPQQRQQSGLTGSSNNQRAPGLAQHLSTGSELFDYDHRSLQFSNQNQYDPVHTHQRQNSRYFNNDNAKPTTTSRFPGQQQFYSSGVQGPPPGLPTAGTPPISGGGMFAHGQGFTNTANTTFGALKDGNVDMHLRGRSGTNDISKRGGVVDLADPSILQARVHQGGVGTGQGLFGGNQVDEDEFPALPTSMPPPGRPIHSRVSSFQANNAGRSSTPKVPPGFNLPHSHPSPSASQAVQAPSSLHRISSLPSGTVLPAVPMLPIGQRAPTPKSKSKETPIEAGRLETITNPRSNSSQGGHGSVAANAGEISLGSPKPKMVPPKVDAHITPLSLADDVFAASKVIRSESAVDDRALAKPATETRTAATAPANPDLQQAATVPPAANILTELKITIPVIASTIVATPPAIASRPSTPATTTSDISRASMPRPRTIRVTTSIPKVAAESAPPSAVTEKSAIIPFSAQSQFKQAQRSRAHSITSAVSQSRPSTPAMSDRFSMTNDMLSRASSPPPSIVGSAPERTKTKAQQKKERKEKAKKVVETSDAGTSSANATPPVVEEVAPVLGRQRKVKKHRPGTGTDSSKARAKTSKSEDKKGFDDVASDSGVPDQDLDIPKEQTLEISTKRKDFSETAQTSATKEKKRRSKSSGFNSPVVKEEVADQRDETLPSSKTPYTLLDLYTESAKHKHDPVFIQKLLNEHVSSIDQMFDSLLKSKEIEPNSALFGGQPSLNSAAFKLPADSRKGAEYLDANGYTDSNPFGHIYLGSKEKKALWNGESFGVADEREGRQGDLLRRALFTGGGVVYRHLTREQEDRVMELEARRDHHAAQWGDIGTMDKLSKLEADDYMNIEGGVEELIRRGEKHGIGWMMNHARDEWDVNGEGDDEDGDQFDDDFEDEDDKTDDLELGNEPSTLGWEISATTGINSKALSALNAKLAVPRALPVTAPVNLRAMDNAQLQKRIVDTQREMDAARKDMERIEKLMMKKTKEVAKWREGIGALRS